MYDTIDDNTIALLLFKDKTDPLKDEKGVKWTAESFVAMDGYITDKSGLYVNDSTVSNVVNNSEFTIEFYFKIEKDVSYTSIFRSTKSNGFYVGVVYESGVLSLRDTTPGSDAVKKIAMPELKTWNNIAITLKNNYYQCFFNGKLTTSIRNYYGSMHAEIGFNIGYDGAAIPVYNISYGPIRISNICRYTEDFNPSPYFPSVDNKAVSKLNLY